MSSGSAKHHQRRAFLFGSRRGGWRAGRGEVCVPAEQIPLTSVRPGAGMTTSSDNDTDVDSSPLHRVLTRPPPPQPPPDYNDVKPPTRSADQIIQQSSAP